MLLTFWLMLRVFDKKINVQDTQTNKKYRCLSRFNISAGSSSTANTESRVHKYSDYKKINCKTR